LQRVIDSDGQDYGTLIACQSLNKASSRHAMLPRKSSTNRKRQTSFVNQQQQQPTCKTNNQAFDFLVMSRDHVSSRLNTFLTAFRRQLSPPPPFAFFSTAFPAKPISPGLAAASGAFFLPSCPPEPSIDRRTAFRACSRLRTRPCARLRSRSVASIPSRAFDLQKTLLPPSEPSTTSRASCRLQSFLPVQSFVLCCLRTLRPPPGPSTPSRASYSLRSLRPPPTASRACYTSRACYLFLRDRASRPPCLHACTPSRPPYLHALQTSRPRLHTPQPPYLQFFRPLRLHACMISRPPRPPDPHDLQTYTTCTSTIKREGRRSPGTAVVAGRIAGISRMVGKR
jgi:hypothetical protein